MGAIRKASVFAVLLLGMFGSSARAQGIVTAKVPFPFVVGSKTFPAGQYDISSMADAGTIVAIRGMNNSAGGFALTNPVERGNPAGDQPALVFTRYESGYRLSQIWESGTEGRELAGLPAGKRTARAEMPVRPSEASTYVLAANWK